MKKAKKLSINPVFASNQTRLAVLIALLSNPDASYSAIGAMVGISKQRVHIIVKGLKDQLPWLEECIEHSQNKQCNDKEKQRARKREYMRNYYKDEKQKAWRREYMRHYYQDE